jgi:hypothetical protein
MPKRTPEYVHCMHVPKFADKYVWLMCWALKTNKQVLQKWVCQRSGANSLFSNIVQLQIKSFLVPLQRSEKAPHYQSHLETLHGDYDMMILYWLRYS